ncbi:MAG: LCP family protein [Candidatus Moranbacteria bacterium]|nr:LCP family protein [Candidatus Moranbacteria bacterium]
MRFGNPLQGSQKKKRPWLRVGLLVGIILVLTVGFFVWKAGSVVSHIGAGSVLENVMQSLPGVEQTVFGEKDGRINILLLGMRGEHVTGGGLLADTIMVLSVVPETNKASLVSVPRDLYVTVPNTSDQSKINAVYYYGEQQNPRAGLDYMKSVISDISGVPIHYAVRIDFAGFVKVVDALGGIPVVLAEEFVEPVQFHEEHVCDANVFTISSGNVQQKIDDRGKVVATYPLCYNPNEECGGVFTVASGESTLDGENALCYVRARATSSDFDRARRQQEVLQILQKKALSLGTLSDFSAINDLFDALGESVQTDMKLWEMKRMYEIYQEMQSNTEMPFSLKQKVLENSDEGLLYAPETNGDGRGYILLPRGDDYSRINALFQSFP